MVRTVAGLKPVSVLWRRLDSLFADPLELAEVSQIGTPGLVGAIRQGSVVMVNAIGSGVLETRAFLAFLPRICEALLGEPLRLPNIATWWCGQPAEREHVRANSERMTLSPALSTRMPFDPEDTAALGGRLRNVAFASISDLLENEGAHLVGQEAVTLSTTPAIVGGALAPRPMSIRVFMARTPNGWLAMPGGYARIGSSDDVTAVGMRQGGSVADVWVMGDGPVDVETMIPRDTRIERGAVANLTSRAAENLFWLGRYIERAEGYIRLTRAYDLRRAENPRADTPLLVWLLNYLDDIGVDAGKDMPPALRDCIDSAILCGRRIRDHLSPDGWAAVVEFERAAGADGIIRLAGGALRHKGAIDRKSVV